MNNSEKLLLIQEAINCVQKNTGDPWATSIYSPLKKKGSNYDIGDFGEILVLELMKKNGINAEIYKKDGLDIKRDDKQDEVKTASLGLKKKTHFFNQIKFSNDKTSGVDFDYLYFVGIFPNNSLQIWRAKNSENLKQTFKVNNYSSWNKKFPNALDKNLWECYFSYDPTFIEQE